MSTCARCGLLEAEDWPSFREEKTLCFARNGYETHTIACRDRELANLRSLLRSVTGKLENTLELLRFDAEHGLPPTNSALELLDSVLGALS